MSVFRPDQRPAGFHIDRTPAAEIKDYLEAGYEPRLYNPLEDPTATARLKELRDTWASKPDTSVVFTSGVFDIFHGNHRAYLLATKMSAVPHHYARVDATANEPWEALSPDERRKYLDYVIGDRVIKQVVSVDGNDAVSERKGFNAAKGNMPRPIYSWESRARDVLSTSITRYGDTYALADAVTIHDRVHPELAGTPHQGIIEIGRFIRPDVWSIYHESTDIVEGLQQAATPEEIEAMHPTLLFSSEGLMEDPLLRGPFSTTALALRISGSAAA